MPIRDKQYPVRFTPRGLVDAFDATDKFPGACTALTNLIFSESNPELVVSRPAATQITNFPGFITPGVISVQVTIGTVTYGMISSGLVANRDQAFAYDNVAGTFIAISNMTNLNLPQSQPTAGAWTPPTMAMAGAFLVVTHPGFANISQRFGWFDLTNPAAPVWNAGDCTGNALGAVPVAVANFNNRFYFAVGNATPYTDVLSLNRTAGTQTLVLGDSSPVLGLSGLPIQTTSSGVVQALIAFKGFQTWQITGDSALSTLAENYLSLNIGCTMPRSVAQSPLGTYFMNIGGPYIIDQFGILRSLTHGGQDLEPDLQQPFENAVVPSRVAGSYTSTIYRVSAQTLINGSAQTNDYWFDEHKRRWTGPHTFTYDCLSQYLNYFIACSNAVPGVLFKSQIQPDATSTYVENGAQLLSQIATSTFPKTGHMVVKQVVESTIELAAGGGTVSYQVVATDEIGNTLNSCNVAVAAPGSLWGTGIWGGFPWGSTNNIPQTYTVPWTLPLVFKKMALNIIANASTALAFGTFFARYKEAGYTNVR